MASGYQHGILLNLQQFNQQLLQVFFVGLTIGMLRTVVPALAESEFGVAKGSFLLLTAFVVAFGVVKGALNFVAGALSEHWGRKKVLLLGWLLALPIPWLIYFAPSWDWIVAATLLLGVNQGLTWSMTQTAKLDLSHANQRGLAIGFNEFAGYLGVALAGIITAYLATALGARLGLLWFGNAVLWLALAFTLGFVKETLPWARAEGRQPDATAVKPPSTWQVFLWVSWQDRRLAVISQAGLVEKFVDALVWVFWPVYLYQQGLSLATLSLVIGIYGLVWGMAQLLTGHWSDIFGRKPLIVSGMWLCGAGVWLMLLGEGVLWWSLAAASTGFGMALLYPTLSAAVADLASPQWRGSAIGVYRFWRDLGYGVGALALGLIGLWFGQVEAGFIFTAVAMFISGGVVLWGYSEVKPLTNNAKS